MPKNLKLWISERTKLDPNWWRLPNYMKPRPSDGTINYPSFTHKKDGSEPSSAPAERRTKIQKTTPYSPDELKRIPAHKLEKQFTPFESPILKRTRSKRQREDDSLFHET